MDQRIIWAIGFPGLVLLTSSFVTANGCAWNADTVPVATTTRKIGVGGSGGLAPDCNIDGSCPECSISEQCGADTDCVTFECAGGVCTRHDRLQGTPAGEQVGGDCKKSQCDGKGGVETVADADPEDDNNECTTDTCHDGATQHAIAPIGAPCTLPSQQGGVCEQGACKRCITKGNMTIGCPAASAHCVNCSSSKYSAANCTEQLCCNSACSGECRACDLEGKSGSCVPLPKGMGGVCADGKLCNGDGSCTASKKLALHQTCEGLSCYTPSGTVECLSEAFRGLSCRTRIGDYCKSDLDCATNYCSGNTCQKCTGSCNSATCDSLGACYFDQGSPCLDPLDCTSLLCEMGICGPVQE